MDLSCGRCSTFSLWDSDVCGVWIERKNFLSESEKKKMLGGLFWGESEREDELKSFRFFLIVSSFSNSNSSYGDSRLFIERW